MDWFSDGREYYSGRCFEGMALACPDRWSVFDSQPACGTLIGREPPKDRVAVIVSGGGSNGPWPEYVGPGLADAAVVGAPYTAPSAYAIYEVGKALDAGKGILLVYNNFMGDYLNNDMAAELLRLEGIDSRQIVCCDDMGMAIGEPRENRGGRTAAPLLLRIAALASREGKSLSEVEALVRKAEARSTTLCVTVDPKTNRATYGRGFSDEPGFIVRDGATVSSTAEEMIRFLAEDARPRPGEKAYLLVNRLRFTHYMDSYVMAARLYKELEKICPVLKMRVGAYNNILDAYGYTVTILCADGEIAPYLLPDCAGDCYLF